MKSSAKVFAVCDEYELSREFLAKDPEKQRAFGAIVNLLKLGTYRWNFNRLTDESRRAFAERMREEYLRPRGGHARARHVRRRLIWEMLNLMMDDFDAFMARFESGM